MKENGTNRASRERIPAKEGIMDRARAKELAPIIQAYGEGEAIETRTHANGAPWVELSVPPEWSDEQDYRVKPETFTRPMTRGEVLYMVTTASAMVVRFPKESLEKIYPAESCTYDYDPIGSIEYAIIDKHGDPVDGWHKFEVTE